MFHHGLNTFFHKKTSRFRDSCPMIKNWFPAKLDELTVQTTRLGYTERSVVAQHLQQNCQYNIKFDKAKILMKSTHCNHQFVGESLNVMQNRNNYHPETNSSS